MRLWGQPPVEPPIANIISGVQSIRPLTVAFDWPSARVSTRRPGKSVEWPVVAGSDPAGWSVEVAEVSMPQRVLFYRYPAVDGSGIPDQETADETICTVDNTTCKLIRTSDGFSVLPTGKEFAGYFIVQATWLAAAAGSTLPPASDANAADFQVSWAFHVKEG